MRPDGHEVNSVRTEPSRRTVDMPVCQRLVPSVGSYKELQPLYERLAARKFVVLAFPCNQFGGQEPGTAEEIRKFVDGYGVTFPMFAKIDVNGPNTHPLYKHLKEKKGEMLGNDIK